MLKSFFPLVLLLATLMATPAKSEPRPFILYAKFLQDTEVELSDGSRWSMDAGDCFPIYMFKDQRTKIILQLGSATFFADASRLKVLGESESTGALINYRRNLENYLKTKADNWKRDAR